MRTPDPQDVVGVPTALADVHPNSTRLGGDPHPLHRLSTGRGGGARGPVSRILSPPRGEGGGHFSGTELALGLERPTRKEGCAGRRAPSLFGLSPSGVCRAGSVTGSAVRSC